MYLGTIGGATTNSLDGVLGPVGIWGRVLDTFEQAALYNGGSAILYSNIATYFPALATDLLAWWDLAETGSGATAVDATGHLNLTDSGGSTGVAR